MAGILCRIAEFHVRIFECHHVIFHVVEILAEEAVEFPVAIVLGKALKFQAKVHTQNILKCV